jgi:dynactin-4
MCPHCRNTLSVVPSDPPGVDDVRSSVLINAVGEAPFYLYCNFCRWDSGEVGITLEKPTGLAAQLQHLEDSAPDSLEFDRLKEHFEPFIRASSLSSSQSAAPPVHLTNSITAAASAALARDIPGVSKYTPHHARRGKDRTKNKDEFPEYKSRLDVSTASVRGSGGGKADVEYMRRLETVGQVASLEQRWENSWSTSLKINDLQPLRLPLHAKRSKRCPQCTHILIKPEQKAQSVRFKIKLVAANYLPSITVSLPHSEQFSSRPMDTAKRSTTTRTEPEATPGLYAGQTYPFHLTLTNPLYDPIQVRLAVQRMHVAAGDTGDRGKRPPFAVSLPSSTFVVAAFAEEWEYEDEDEDMFGLDDDFGLGSRDNREENKAKAKTVGVIEKRANLTTVGGEIVVGKDAQGPVRFNMLISYAYRSDDGLGEEVGLASKTTDTKTFSFYTVVDLGVIAPKPVPKADTDF